MTTVAGPAVETAELPPSNLVFLIDTSGSMNDPNKLPLVKSSLRTLASQLTAPEPASQALGPVPVVVEEPEVAAPVVMTAAPAPSAVPGGRPKVG